VRLLEGHVDILASADTIATPYIVISAAAAEERMEAPSGG
jgi:hypothetical protein